MRCSRALWDQLESPSTSHVAVHCSSARAQQRAAQLCSDSDSRCSQTPATVMRGSSHLTPHATPLTWCRATKMNQPSLRGDDGRHEITRHFWVKDLPARCIPPLHHPRFLLVSALVPYGPDPRGPCAAAPRSSASSWDSQVPGLVGFFFQPTRDFFIFGFQTRR